MFFYKCVYFTISIQLYFETEQKFKNNFYEDLLENTHLAKRTISQYRTDSFNTLVTDKGIDFWEMIGNDNLTQAMKDTIESFWKLWTEFYSLHVNVSNHTNIVAGIDRINDFVKKNPEWIDIIKKESKEVNSLFYDKCKNTFINGYSEDLVAPLIDDLKNEIGNHNKEVIKERIESYLYITGLFSPENNEEFFIKTDIMQITLSNIAKDSMQGALERIKENIIEIEHKYLYQYKYRRNWLKNIAEENNINIDFSDDIFKKIPREFEKYRKNDIWTVTDKIKEIEINETITYKNNDPSLERRIANIPTGLHLVTIENIKLNENHDYHKIFTKGLFITGVYEIIENKQDGKELKLKLVDNRKRIWYHDTYPHNFSFIKTYQWKAKALSDFILKDTSQDIDLYAERFGKKQKPSEDFETFSEEISFTDDLFITDNKIKEIQNLILKKKNVILQGAPGVGKSFSAKKIAYSLIGDEDETRIKQIQFHQSYSYEDFVMGYRPTKDGFELKNGPFYDFCKIAEEDIDNEYFFIIDEINRGNISKIFGELLMLIEQDKRGENYAVELLYSDEKFYVPENVFIIGMMNTADRSLAMIDYAFRRRFAFFELEPAFDNDKFKKMISNAKNEKLNSLVEHLNRLNIEIKNDSSLGKGFVIGHSYVTKNSEVNDTAVSSIINYEILPLLEEYWFDDIEQVNKWKQILLGILNV